MPPLVQPFLSDLLRPEPGILINDPDVVAFDEILWLMPSILDDLMGEEINRDGLLAQNISAGFSRFGGYS